MANITFIKLKMTRFEVTCNMCAQAKQGRVRQKGKGLWKIKLLINVSEPREPKG